MEISREEYVQFLKDTLMVRAFEAGGVDNWDYYDHVLENYVGAIADLVKKNILTKEEAGIY